jgi:hypothetical protein
VPNNTHPPRVIEEQQFGGRPGGVSFAELTWAQWQRSKKGPAEADDAYAAVRAEFIKEHGDVLAAYWSERAPAAVALTTGRDRLFRRRRPEYHCASDWTSAGVPQIANLLFRCDSLAARTAETVSPSASRIALHGVFSVSRHLMETAEARSEGRARVLLDELAKQLDQVEAYVERAARARASWSLFVALLSGLAVLVAVSLAVDAALSSSVVTAPAAAVIAGSVGATLSALTRISTGRFVAPTDVGQGTIYVLAFTRPAVGALLGGGAYFLLTAFSFISTPRTELYGAIGFLIGFAERFAHVVPSVTWSEIEVKSLEQTIDESVRSSLVGPQLAKWTGFVAVSLPNNPTRDGQPIVAAGELLDLEVHFGPDETGGSFERIIDIQDGVKAPEVSFQVRADSDAVAAASEEHTVQVAVGGNKSTLLQLLTPNTPGDHRIWVRVSQLNRIVQLVPIDIRVQEAA